MLQKKTHNKFIYDFTCLLLLYDHVVTSKETKSKTRKRLYDLFEIRMLKHDNWFKKNTVITSSYKFCKMVLDSTTGTW